MSLVAAASNMLETSLAKVEEKIHDLEWEAHLTSQAHSHTAKEMEKEFYAPIRKLKGEKHELCLSLHLLQLKKGE